MHRRSMKFASRAAVLDEAGSRQPLWKGWRGQVRCLRAGEEGSGFTARSAPSELGE
jgi:hypothetical protein